MSLSVSYFPWGPNDHSDKKPAESEGETTTDSIIELLLKRRATSGFGNGFITKKKEKSNEQQTAVNTAV